MNYKAVKFETKSIDDAKFEGYASFFNNIDSYGDIIEKGAFSKTIKENVNRIKVLWQHDPTEPIGIPEVMAEDENGLYVKAKISATDAGKKAMTLIRDGVVTEMSIGFDIVKSDYKPVGNKRFRLIKEVKLWEFSPVTFAANDQAKILQIKSLLQSTDNDTIGKALSYIQSLKRAEPSRDTMRDHIEPTEIYKIIERLKGGKL
jgi:hypothetical protein